MIEPAAGRSFIDHVRRALAATGLSPPRAGEACVVLFDTTPWSAFEAEASLLLDAAERERASRFRFDHDRCAYVLAHALWRVVLAACLERDTGEVPLAFRPSGQPCLPGTSLATSLSHSGPVVLMAVGNARMLGVDVERWPPRVRLDELLPVICAPEEAGVLGSMPAARRERALLQLWTRKEALLKAFGTGLAQAPASFCARPGEPVRPPSDPDGSPCRVADLALAGEWMGALAASLEVTRYRLHAPATGAGPTWDGCPCVQEMASPDPPETSPNVNQ